MDAEVDEEENQADTATMLDALVKRAIPKHKRARNTNQENRRGNTCCLS